MEPFQKEIEVKSDDRGTFVPYLNNLNNLPEEKNLQIKRNYYVYNYGKGVIRGFHYHKKEWKYFIIVNGAAKFIALDPKAPEKTFTFISSARKPNLIVIPPNYANGWISLENNTILACASTASFEESINDDQRFDPYTWGDVWSIKAR